jgi:hypothetical protein
LRERDRELAEKDEDVERHRIFSKFLEGVVVDKDGGKEGFADITDL